MIRPLLAVGLAASLTACARDDTVYPSLAARPVEKLGFAEPETPVATAQPDPALDAKIAELTRQMKTIADGFTADAARAQAAVTRARGGRVGSDAWLDAQGSLAELDDWRSQASALVTGIDDLAAGRAAALAPDYPALGPLKDLAEAEADREAETIGRLQVALPGA